MKAILTSYRGPTNTRGARMGAGRAEHNGYILPVLTRRLGDAGVVDKIDRLVFGHVADDILRSPGGAGNHVVNVECQVARGCDLAVDDDDPSLFRSP